MAGGDLILPEVATPTTPASANDGLFASNATPSVLSRVDSAGTIWTYTPMFIQQLTANFTLLSQTGAQPALNGSANGQITLPASTSYNFEALYMITNTGTTSHTWGTLFGGTATLTGIAYSAEAYTATSNALTAPNMIYATAATILVVTAASTSATENVQIILRGTIEINAAGTLIPQVKTSAATGVAPVMLLGSYFKMWQTGSNANAYIGNWS